MIAEYSTSQLKIACLESTYLIDVSDISHLHACSNYSYIYFKEKYILASKTLRHFHDQLKMNRFIRTHRSYSVNIDHVESINYRTREIRLHSGIIIPISRSRWKVVKSALC